MDDDDFDATSPVVRRTRPIDFLVLGLFFVDEIAGAIHATTTAAYNLAAMHSNFVHEQATFREEAALEIEQITGEADG